MDKKLPASVVLFERDRKVLRLMALGMSVPEMSEELFVGQATVEVFCKQVKDKLGTDEHEEICSYAKGLGLV